MILVFSIAPSYIYHCLNDYQKRYKGTEATPLGRGYSAAAAYEDGRVRWGTDGTPYISLNKRWKSVKHENGEEITPKECEQNIVVYEGKIKQKGITSIRSIRGVKAGKSSIYPKLPGEAGIFSPIALSLPNDIKWRKKSVSDDWKTWSCGDEARNWIRNRKPLPKTGYDIVAWLSKTRSKHLRIADIKRLHEGDQLTLAVADRNLYDTLDHVKPPVNKAMLPAKFWKYSCATYTHKKDLTGTLTLHSSGSDDIVLDKFQFEVEYTEGHMYPLDSKGYLPAKDPQGFFPLLGVKTHWTELSPKTKIGFRGYMIDFKQFPQTPLIYYDQEHSVYL